MKRIERESRIPSLLGFQVVCALTLVTATLYCQTPTSGEGPTAPGQRTITVEVGRSQVIEAPWLVKRASVTNPEVADVQAISPDKILVQGKTVGSTDVFLWSEQDEAWQARVDVMADLWQMEASLARMFPGTKLSLSQSRDVVVVGGSLERAEQVQQLKQFLEASGYRYVDTTKLAGVQQVQIQVRVAEVSRNAIRTLTVNAFKVGEDAFGAMTLGTAVGGAMNPISIGIPEGAPAVPNIPFSFTNDLVVTPVVTLFGGLTEQNAAIFIQALSENLYLRVLAEPNLIALSGEEASFLAGGEYPIPVVQGGTTASTSITIEYREFGVRLRFRPTVLGDSKIRILVAPEVSEISDTGAVEIQGFRIPSIATRRAQTTVELRSGQTFALAGLLSSKRGLRNSRIPFLGDIPILGTLFRSTRYENGETELVVVVTASLVEPISTAKVPPLPGSLEMPDSDWEIFFRARGTGDMPGVPRPEDPAVYKAMKLGTLRGPGAWTSHDKSPAHGQGSQQAGLPALQHAGDLPEERKTEATE